MAGLLTSINPVKKIPHRHAHRPRQSAQFLNVILFTGDEDYAKLTVKTNQNIRQQARLQSCKQQSRAALVSEDLHRLLPRQLALLEDHIIVQMHSFINVAEKLLGY